MINLTYERDGKEFNFIQVRNLTRLLIWIRALKNLGEIKIVKIIVK